MTNSKPTPKCLACYFAPCRCKAGLAAKIRPAKSTISHNGDQYTRYFDPEWGSISLLGVTCQALVRKPARG